MRRIFPNDSKRRFNEIGVPPNEPYFSRIIPYKHKHLQTIWGTSISGKPPAVEPWIPLTFQASLPLSLRRGSVSWPAWWTGLWYLQLDDDIRAVTNRPIDPQCERGLLHGFTQQYPKTFWVWSSVLFVSVLWGSRYKETRYNEIMVSYILMQTNHWNWGFTVDVAREWRQNQRSLKSPRFLRGPQWWAPHTHKLPIHQSAHCLFAIFIKLLIDPLAVLNTQDLLLNLLRHHQHTSVANTNDEPWVMPLILSYFTIPVPENYIMLEKRPWHRIVHCWVHLPTKQMCVEVEQHQCDEMKLCHMKSPQAQISRPTIKRHQTISANTCKYVMAIWELRPCDYHPAFPNLR